MFDTGGTSRVAGLLNGNENPIQAQQALNEDLNQFLTLLTTQLLNQDPLEPMETSEFTNQLVQFASVEQSIAANQKLEALLQQNIATTQMAALNYIDQEVQYVGDTGLMQNGQMKFRIAPDLEPNEITVEILDESGDVVRTLQPPPSGRPQDVVWDGKDEFGNQLEDGIYSIRASAVDNDGANIQVFTGVFGTVTGVQVSQFGDVTLSIGEMKIPLSSVISIGSNPLAGLPIDPLADPEPETEFGPFDPGTDPTDPTLTTADPRVKPGPADPRGKLTPVDPGVVPTLTTADKPGSFEPFIPRPELTTAR